MTPSSLSHEPYLDSLPDRLGNLTEESELARHLLGRLADLDWQQVSEIATPWVIEARAQPAPFWALESLLKEYPISSAEGLALMRLAEALLRIPDLDTAIALTADQFIRADFSSAEASAHPLMANLSATAIGLSKRMLGGPQQSRGLFKRLGAHTVVKATVRAVQLLGHQFVLGENIDSALSKAAELRKLQPSLRFSFDMLGEGARTEKDALRYFAAYQHAIKAVGKQKTNRDPRKVDGISVKLSALFARYEWSQYRDVENILVPRLISLVGDAAAQNLPLTIDAEECERLELSLAVLEQCARWVNEHHANWQGLGFAVQAYQQRATQVIDEIARICDRTNIFMMVRLVKGAYWDFEIKRAQELGLSRYPVFTHKQHSDLSYLAAAKQLFEFSHRLYPQFASHNAGTLAAILHMAKDNAASFELQRLFGMGESIYRQVMSTATPPALRIYAPVGQHRDLLAYLVRRLLENGANSSFVNQLHNENVAIAGLLRSPLQAQPDSGLVLPGALFGSQRKNANGIDLSASTARNQIQRAIEQTALANIPQASQNDVNQCMSVLQEGFAAWRSTSINERCQTLRRAADSLENEIPQWVGMLVVEGKKTIPDSVSEVRELIDFLRYYAQQAQRSLLPRVLPGPTGEHNEYLLQPRGIFVCISPWNFPLAIFGGQVAAALVCGNVVAAKPAEQTPAIAFALAELLYRAGIPRNALQCLHGAGELIGAALTGHELCAGVAFTGSTEVAQVIAQSLLMGQRPLRPLIAETGGINAMIVDSTALPEQVVEAVVQSAFRSAGQRCSALRLLCVQDDIADALIEMLVGAMTLLKVDEARHFHTDVGPVIDAAAHQHLHQHIEKLCQHAKTLGRTPMAQHLRDTHIAPIACEIDRVADVREEIFGPVLHVVRWRGDVLALVDEINALGYGLTLGIQTRIDSRAKAIAQRARIGNIYVNRNMIGAVVGSQPFGGQGLSGTGPKAGGPNYLMRFCTEQVISTNTAAAGGNAALLAGAASRNSP